MREAPIRSRAGDPRAGYVLIEVVATLAIVTLALRLALPSLGSGTTPPRFAALVGAAAALLRDARTAAIETNRPVPARFDAARRRLSAGAATVVFPADVAVSLTAGGNCPAGDGAAAIVFRPDGTNCGGVLRLSRGSRTISTRVDWVDGGIDVRAGG